MFMCPHCGKPSETVPPRKVPWHRYDPGGGTVSLGCGTLILIAIIVAIFSNGDESDEIRGLQRDIQQLEKKIDKLSLTPKIAGAAEAE